MMGGWIKLHRNLTHWQWYDDSLMVHLFIHLLLSANFEERQWRGITIRRGQLVTSTQQLAEGIHSTYKMVFSRLCKLEKSGEISKIRNNQFSIITITKYDDYMDADPSDGTAEGQRRDSDGTQYKNIISKEHIKKNTPLTPQGGKDDLLDTEELNPWRAIAEVPQAPKPPVARTPLSPAFEKWLAYKREKRQSYRSERALRACYNQLEHYSKGDPKVAMEIIERSIAMNYSGFFEPKAYNKHHEHRPESITNAAESEKGTRYSTI
ncbi:hypothetical protein [Porphyromonas levii]|uniref:hypothetical protein n=1 Tax=Porphyromonas levii TaxID=28114 RepID=UPI001BAADD32|nr:hypothetical protein [Porphyromonas levii]MBR8805992.1 hypothetical protein [Porphyromonas levii]